MVSEHTNQVNQSLFPDGVLITGQYSTETAELYVPSSNVSCSLPKLPDTRYGHTVENTGLLCGGYGSEEVAGTCLQWSPDTGNWEEMFTWDNEYPGRADHVSWTPRTDIGTFLMGGEYDGRSTTWIKPDGTQEMGYRLKYDIQ